MPFLQSLKQVSDLCQGPPNARNHLAVRTEVKINSRLSPAILRDGAQHSPSRKWEEQSEEQGHYVLCGWAKGGMLSTSQGPTSSQKKWRVVLGYCWKKQNFLEGGGGAERKKRNGKTWSVGKCFMTKYEFYPSTSMREPWAFLRGETKTQAEAEKVQAGTVKASPRTFEMVWWLACGSFYM